MLAGLVSLALLAPAAPGPTLDRGAEYVYAGTVTEAIDRPGTRFRRAHEVEVRVLVLEKFPGRADAAVLTLLRRSDDPDHGPPAARLDLVRIHEDGTTHLLRPAGAAPLRLAPDTPVHALPPPPLDTFAPAEFGPFPPRGGPGQHAWTAAEPGRPGVGWQAGGTDFINGERCGELRGVQKSETWDHPRGGVTAWERTESVWVSMQDGAARRVHRLIRHRDGLGDGPAVTVEVRYELRTQTRLLGPTYARYRTEVETAYAAGVEADPLVRDAVRIGPQPFAARLARLDAFLADNQPGTPYREAVLSVRRRLDAARRGETAPVPILVPTPAVAPVPRSEAGQPAPDFRAGDFRLSAARGKPVVLVFFMPGQETAELSLAVADALTKRYSGRVVVAPLAVFADPALAAKDMARRRLSVPVYDGSAAVDPYGVETFPRFVVVDRAGAVRWAFAGVGAETGYLVREQVEAVLSPPTATASPTPPPIPPQ
ncbi:MAG TPA: hypothetical protein VH092_02115 [Urbifossiella sp.]|nr:hypothetical protein [Urbifossiella sp.]